MKLPGADSQGGAITPPDTPRKPRRSISSPHLSLSPVKKEARANLHTYYKHLLAQLVLPPKSPCFPNAVYFTAHLLSLDHTQVKHPPGKKESSRAVLRPAPTVDNTIDHKNVPEGQWVVLTKPKKTSGLPKTMGPHLLSQYEVDSPHLQLPLYEDQATSETLTPYANGGDLYSYCVRRQKEQKPFTFDELYLIIHRILLAIQALHTHVGTNAGKSVNLVHREINLNHLFVDADHDGGIQNLTLGNFGTLTQCNSSDGLINKDDSVAIIETWLPKDYPHSQYEQENFKIMDLCAAGIVLKELLYDHSTLENPSTKGAPNHPLVDGLSPKQKAWAKDAMLLLLGSYQANKKVSQDRRRPTTVCAILNEQFSSEKLKTLSSREPASSPKVMAGKRVWSFGSVEQKSKKRKGSVGDDGGSKSKKIAASHCWGDASAGKQQLEVRIGVSDPLLAYSAPLRNAYAVLLDLADKIKHLEDSFCTDMFDENQDASTYYYMTVAIERNLEQVANELKEKSYKGEEEKQQASLSRLLGKIKSGEDGYKGYDEVKKECLSYISQDCSQPSGQEGELKRVGTEAKDVQKDSPTDQAVQEGGGDIETLFSYDAMLTRLKGVPDTIDKVITKLNEDFSPRYGTGLFSDPLILKEINRLKMWLTKKLESESVRKWPGQEQASKEDKLLLQLLHSDVMGVIWQFLKGANSKLTLPARVLKGQLDTQLKDQLGMSFDDFIELQLSQSPSLDPGIVPQQP